MGLGPTRQDFIYFTLYNFITLAASSSPLIGFLGFDGLFHYLEVALLQAPGLPLLAPDTTLL